MGIQDRDNYVERHKATTKSNIEGLESSRNQQTRRYRKTPNKSAGGLRYLLMPALMLLALWYGADVLLKKKASDKYPGLSPTLLSAPSTTANPIPGGIEMKADRQGHFRGTVLINNVPMPFMIDTGATKTSIPAKLAYAASLSVGKPIVADTAGGKVVDRLTNINSLKIGNAEIRNLEASINEHLEEVLIGMNTLKYFNMTQSGNTMTLVANASSAEQTLRAPTIDQATARNTEQAVIKRPTLIKKTISCDARQVCITKYSDH